MLTVPGLRMIGTAQRKGERDVCSFSMELDTGDVGSRAQPRRHRRSIRPPLRAAHPAPHLGSRATVRPSLAFYNTCEDIDTLVAALKRMQGGHAQRA